jgi:acyl-CoA dehydrogenase
MYDDTDEKRLLLNTVKKFMEEEMYPHEEKIDKLGYVPEEIGQQIAKKINRNRTVRC